MEIIISCVFLLLKGGMDYAWTSSPAVMTLTFDSTNLLTPQCFNITIIDDDLVEGEEMFTIALTAPNNPRGQIVDSEMSTDPLISQSALIFITDNDGKLAKYHYLFVMSSTS